MMVRGHRVITDEPQGICIGFRPAGVEYDSFDVYDNGGRNAFYQRDYIVVTDLEEVGGEAPADLMVWRTPDEFNTWREEMG